jgi:hypothetical protein
MTKNEIWDEIKTKFNETELDTLGINSRSSKAEMENILGQAPKETNPAFEPGKAPMEVLNNEAYNDGKEHDESEINKTQTDEPEVEPEKDQFDELLGKISGAEAGQPKEKVVKPIITKEKRKRKKGESSAESFRIEGYILLLATDTLFPTLLAWVNNMVDKKHRKLMASDLQLSQKDFDKLEPLADQAADYMSVNLNPIAGFFLVSAFMYTNNMIVIKMTVEPVKPETK